MSIPSGSFFTEILFLNFPVYLLYTEYCCFYRRFYTIITAITAALIAKIMRPVVYTIDLGTLSYNEAWRLQETLQQKLIDRKRRQQWSAKSAKDMDSGETETRSVPKNSGSESELYESDPAGYLLFVEHPHVFTIGKSGNYNNLLFTDDVLTQKGIEVVKTDRGGDVTYHGPGQMVGYPILDLEQFGLGVAAYIERLEEVIIRTAAHFGITAQRIPSRTGVWVGNNKLCAMGIKCSRYVSMHGFALNIRTDLDYFHGIIPCGIDDGGVTSFEKMLNHTPETNDIRKCLVAEFENRFECSIAESPRAGKWILQF